MTSGGQGFVVIQPGKIVISDVASVRLTGSNADTLGGMSARIMLCEDIAAETPGASCRAGLCPATASGVSKCRLEALGEAAETQTGTVHGGGATNEARLGRFLVIGEPVVPVMTAVSNASVLIA